MSQSWGSSTRASRAQRVGLAAVQPRQLGDRERGDRHAAARRRPRRGAARQLLQQPAGVGRRLGVVPELGRPHHLAVGRRARPCRAAGRPRRWPRRAGAPALGPRRARTPPTTPSGSCSLRGGVRRRVRGAGPTATTAPVSASRTSTLVDCVDESTPATSGTAVELSDAEQQLGDELVEPLVAVALGGQRVDVVRLARMAAIASAPRPSGDGRLGELGGLGDGQRLLDLGVVVEAARLLREDEVGAHATASEVPHAVGVLGAVGVGVEVAHARPARVLEQLHEVEGVADALGPEPEVLVELADALRVEVDVEQLPVPQRLGHGVGEVQAGHRLVGELGVQADHVRPLELVDERQRMADRRQEHVAAGLVGLRLEGDTQVGSRARGRTRSTG